MLMVIIETGVNVNDNATRTNPKCSRDGRDVLVVEISRVINDKMDPLRC